MPSLRNVQLNYSGKSLGSFSLVSHLKILEEVADLFKVEEIEANFDMSLFSWKFLETFILRPREEKPDNVAVNIDSKSLKYFYCSLDNEHIPDAALVE